MKLTRPLISFDLETTGLQYLKDRIVEIAAVKLMPDGSELQKTMRINPIIPIPPDATDVHGITRDDIKDAPTFKDVSGSLLKFFEGCDVTGYNLAKFDVPMLSVEFKRCGITWPEDDINIVDALIVMRRMESRNLGWALQFYCNEILEDAHSALPDAEAALKILLAQAVKYDAEDLSALKDLQRDPNQLDRGGFFVKAPHGIQVTFGKYRGKLLKQVKDTYLTWLLSNDFPDDVKDIVTKELEARARR